MKRLSVTCPIVAAIVLACGQTRTHANFFGHIVWIERGAIGQPGTLHTARLDGSHETIISNTVINGSGLSYSASRERIYWAEQATANIRSANIDGYDVTVLPSSSLPNYVDTAIDDESNHLYAMQVDRIQRYDLDQPGSVLLYQFSASAGTIALDPTEDKIYWSQSRTPQIGAPWVIYRSDLDGANREEVLEALAGSIFVDYVNDRLFWSELDVIRTATLDGNNVQDLITGGTIIGGLRADLVEGKLYWFDNDAMMIRRANLDGSMVENVISTTTSLRTFTVIPVPEPSSLMLVLMFSSLLAFRIWRRGVAGRSEVLMAAG